MPTQQIIFTEALRLYCKEHQIGQTRLSRESGLPSNTAAVFLRNERELSAQNFAKLLRWSMNLPSQTVAQNLPEHLTDDEHSVRQDALMA